MEELFFNFPTAAFLLLWLIPLLVGQWALKRYRDKQQAFYAAPSTLTHLLFPRSFRLTLLKNIGWLTIWALVCLALMAPFGNTRYLSSLSPASSTKLLRSEVIFLVDTSASMRVLDGTHQESRLEEAKEIMEEIMKQLRGPIVSLYTFTSVLTPVVPPTLDYLFARLAIRDLQITQEGPGGTLFFPVLEALRQKIFSAPSSRHYTLILLSDGGDNEKEDKRVLEVLPNPSRFHFHLLTIGLGSTQAKAIPDVSFQGKPVLSRLEPTILKQLAEKNRGHYYMAEEWVSSDLAQEIVNQIDQEAFIASSSKREANPLKAEERIVDLYYQIPLGVALLLYLLNLLLPDVSRQASFIGMMIPLFFLPSLQAEEAISSLGYHAEVLWEAKEPSEAFLLYKKMLASPLSSWQRARILYNLGTVYLSEQQPTQALSYFKRVIPTDLSLPSFARDLLINEGIAYWQQSQLTLLHPSSFSFIQREMLLEQSLKVFQEAERSPLAEQWKLFIQQQLHSLRKERRQHWLERRQALSPESSFKSLIISLRVLLWQETITPMEIQAVQHELDQLGLKPDLEALSSEDPLLRRFFLLSTLSQLEALKSSPDATAKDILAQVLTQAENAWQLSFLWQLMQPKGQPELVDILHQQQQRVIAQAKQFIPTALKEQKHTYEQNTPSSCQQFPWEQAIPLFHHGQTAAEEAEKLFSSSLTSEPLLSLQDQTWQEWQRALHLLLLPPPSTSSKSSCELNKTLCLIQEMYLQDQAETQPQMKELHTW